jgi:two-component system, NtrC family, response regulator HydG
MTDRLRERTGADAFQFNGRQPVWPNQTSTVCPSFSGMIGESQRMNGIYNFIDRVANGGSTILVQGESGTGKELVARAIHNRGARSDRPFVAVNCAALTESLLESELFGYERGAFTGALGRSKGLIEHAEGGTFFMDEIGELAPTIQAKLLRVLQDRRVTRVGGRNSFEVDVRFIAATNKSLLEEVQEGNFRADLYYRINVVSVSLPPLRERREDILLLANHFLLGFNQQCQREINGLSVAVQELMAQYAWPGNVRELSNVVERAVLLGSTPEIVPEDLPDTILLSLRSDLCSRDAGPDKYRQSLADCRRQTLQQAIYRSGGNLTRAAKLLGVHRNYLYRMMKSLDLRQPSTTGELPSW